MINLILFLNYLFSLFKTNFMENEQIENIYKVFLESQRKAEEKNKSENQKANNPDNSFESSDHSNCSDDESVQNKDSSRK